MDYVIIRHDNNGPKKKEEEFMTEIKKEDGKTAPERCPYCKEKIIIKRGPGFSSKEEKTCPTSGCEFNKPPWGRGNSNSWCN